MDRFAVEELAGRFWELAGGKEEFPRSLERAISWALPLTIVKLPRLSVAVTEEWLARHGIAFRLKSPDRRLSALLVANRGRGVVFLDGSDTDNERRFSLAHETAHFLIDYWFIWQRVLDLLGDRGREILVGEREPTPQERLSGVLRGIRVGEFCSLMDRHPNGTVTTSQILSAEDRADRLALELLAPRSNVRIRMQKLGIAPTNGDCGERVAQFLEHDFGLPGDIAAAYARMIVVSLGVTPSVRDWLGIKQS